jgi:hypothetical protein
MRKQITVKHAGQKKGVAWVSFNQTVRYRVGSVIGPIYRPGYERELASGMHIAELASNMSCRPTTSIRTGRKSTFYFSSGPQVPFEIGQRLGIER